jgi:hypothetical protein
VSGLTHSQTAGKHATASRPNWPLGANALVILALAFAVAAFLLTLTDDDRGTTVVREVTVTPAASAPAHFKERPHESVVAGAVGAAFDTPRSSVSPFLGLSGEAQMLYEGSEYGTSQYRVDPSTGYATPVPDGDVYGWHDKP